MGATRLILSVLDCPEAIHRGYYLNMFLSNHTDGSLENMLFNLLPKHTLKFYLFFFFGSNMLFATYCNTKFFIPKLKAETVSFLPRADTVLHI